MCVVSLWSFLSLFFPSLFNFVLSTSVLPKQFLMHEKMNALNSSRADAHEKGRNIFYCSVNLFSKRETSRQAAIAFNVSAPGPAREDTFSMHKNVLSGCKNEDPGGHRMGICAGQVTLPISVVYSVFVEEALC